MAQVVSRWPLTAKARVRSRVNPCGFCGGQSGIGTGFYPSSSGFPVSIILPGLHTHISSGGRTIGPLVAAVQRHGLTPSKKKHQRNRRVIDCYNFR
jgi:hypothetical protein